jgi:hypothetical protein
LLENGSNMGKIGCEELMNPSSVVAEEREGRKKETGHVQRNISVAGANWPPVR